MISLTAGQVVMVRDGDFEITLTGLGVQGVRIHGWVKRYPIPSMELSPEEFTRLVETIKAICRAWRLVKTGSGEFYDP